MVKRYLVTISLMMFIVLVLPVLVCAISINEPEDKNIYKNGTRNTKVEKMSLLPAIVLETQENPDAVVIWLHGLGADGNDFAPIVPELRLPDDLAIRFIFPHAPSIPVTVNGGYVMPAWYDILEMEIDRKVDTTQLMISAEAVKRFVLNEIELGIDSRRIILAGFSQGGAVAYQVALSSEDSFGGLLVMSTYFATGDIIELSEQNKEISIEAHHGNYDPVVPESLGEQAVMQLRKKGYEVNYRTYNMEHTVCPQQIEDISAWLQQRLRE